MLEIYFHKKIDFFFVTDQERNRDHIFMTFTPKWRWKSGVLNLSRLRILLFLCNRFACFYGLRWEEVEEEGLQNWSFFVNVIITAWLHIVKLFWKKDI